MPPAATSSNVSNETVVSYQREYSLQKRTVEEESGKLRSILKRAKSAGINTKALSAAHQLSKQEPEIVRAELMETIRYAALRQPLVWRKDLFDGIDISLGDKALAEQQQWDAEDIGYQAGANGRPREDNPYPAGSEMRDRWDRAWLRGKGAAEQQAGPESKVADATRKRGGNKAASAPSKVTPIGPKRRGRPPGSRNKANGGSASPFN